MLSDDQLVYSFQRINTFLRRHAQTCFDSRCSAQRCFDLRCQGSDRCTFRQKGHCVQVQPRAGTVRTPIGIKDHSGRVAGSHLSLVTNFQTIFYTYIYIYIYKQYILLSFPLNSLFVNILRIILLVHIIFTWYRSRPLCRLTDVRALTGCGY